MAIIATRGKYAGGRTGTYIVQKFFKTYVASSSTISLNIPCSMFSSHLFFLVSFKHTVLKDMMLYHTNVLLHGQLGTECRSRVQKFTKTYEALSKLARISEFFMNPEYPKTRIVRLTFVLFSFKHTERHDALQSHVSSLTVVSFLYSPVFCLVSQVSYLMLFV